MGEAYGEEHDDAYKYRIIIIIINRRNDEATVAGEIEKITSSFIHSFIFFIHSQFNQNHQQKKLFSR